MTGSLFCDFVVFTEKALVVVRIMPDSTAWEAALQKAKTFFNKCILPALMQATPCEGESSGVNDAGENCVEGGVGGNCVGDAGDNCVEGGVGGNSVGGVGGNSGVGDTGENCVTGGMGRNSIEGGTGKNCVEGGVGEKAGSDCPLGNNKRGQPHTDRAPLSPPKKRE